MWLAVGLLFWLFFLLPAKRQTLGFKTYRGVAKTRVSRGPMDFFSV
jgi:hypothetical protein